MLSSPQYGLLRVSRLRFRGISQQLSRQHRAGPPAPGGGKARPHGDTDISPANTVSTEGDTGQTG